MDGRAPDTSYINKQRSLVMCSRGIKARERHLLSDLMDLLPHAKKDMKFDSKRSLTLINEIAEMKNCNNCIYFQAVGNALYMWVAKTPQGPSIKYQILNIHTMDELKLTGNCLKHSRPLLSFDKSFETGGAHMELMKEALMQAFGSPKGHPKTKPFIDHVFNFAVTDGKIWFRNYQIVYDPDLSASTKTSKDVRPVLVEVGPRFVLWPIKILSGAFQGQSLWENSDYRTPAVERKRKIVEARQSKGHTDDEYKNKTVDKIKRLKKELVDSILPETELDTVFQNINDDDSSVKAGKTESNELDEFEQMLTNSGQEIEQDGSEDDEDASEEMDSEDDSPAEE